MLKDVIREMTEIFCDNDKCVMLNTESECTAKAINLYCNDEKKHNSFRCMRYEKI